MGSDLDNPDGVGVSEKGGEKVRRFRYSESTSAPATPNFGSVAVAPMPLGWEMEWTRIAWASAAAAVCFLLLYPSDLRQLVDRWSTDSGWSHGFVVPLIAIFFIRLKWETLRRLVPKGSWMGLVLLVIGVCSQVLFRATGLPNMSTLSIIVVLLGAVLFIFGWEYLKILWLPIAYLAFAFPPPPPLYVRITTPMQFLAAELGVQLLPLFGCDATRTGTVIHVLANGVDFPLSVEEACSGMRMLVAFFALAVALAYSTDRPVWQKLTLAACALPIAILCNGLRVTLTGVLAVRVGGQWAEGKAHEYFGLLMLGPAMLMQLGVGWILDHIFVETPDRTLREAPMSEATPATMAVSSPVMRIAARRAFVHALVTAAVLAAGIFVVHGLEAALHATFDKPPAPLSHPLDDMQRKLGDPMRYEAMGPDQVLKPEIVETLGTVDYLLRDYRDRNVAPGQPGEYVNLNVNYYATGSSTPHVPELCWTGSGRVEADASRVVFDVNDVKRKDGSLVNLRVKLISFVPDEKGDAGQIAALAGSTSEPVYSNVAYVFQVNGEYVANAREVSSHFWKASNRYAYHAKIEVTPLIRVASAGQQGSRPLVCTQKQAEAIVSDFLRSAVPAVEECLPDPAILTGSKPTTDNGNTR